MNTQSPFRRIPLSRLAGLVVGLSAMSIASAQGRARDEQRAPAQSPAPTQNTAPSMERAQPAPARSFDRPQGDNRPGRSGLAEAPRPTPRSETNGERRNNSQPGRPNTAEAPRPTPQAGVKRAPSPEVAGPATFSPATNAILEPRALPRWTEQPTREQWQQRDLFAEIQAMARRGFLLVHPIGEEVDAFTGIPEVPAGWKAYGFRVPAGEKLHVRLRHSNEGWFRLMMVDKWGQIEKGMLQNLIPTGNPEVSYTNFSDQPRSVYVIVDDPALMSSLENPYRVKVERSWDPAQKKVDGATVTTGIWAQKQVKAQPEPAAAAGSAEPLKMTEKASR